MRSEERGATCTATRRRGGPGLTRDSFNIVEYASNNGDVGGEGSIRALCVCVCKISRMIYTRSHSQILPSIEDALCRDYRLLGLLARSVIRMT